MKRYDQKKSGFTIAFVFRILGGIAVLCFFIVSLHITANAASISGESNTIFRMQQMDGRNLYPLYEYLHFSGSDTVGDKGVISFSGGGWGRADLRDKSNDSNPYGDLQYGYISYGGNQNNLAFNAGRQFVTEGVAAERLDGLHLHSDLANGFGTAVFVGAPVVTQSNFKGGDVVYGGKISHGIAKYYTIGLSALRTDYDNSRIREEEGIDVWFHPLRQVDLWGRSSYNSITSGWMEHAYSIAFSPLDQLRFTGDLSKVNYKDYFYQVTTSALSLMNGLLDPNENVFSLGGSIEYVPITDLRIVVDFKDYDYGRAGQAKYYGGKATFSLPDSYGAGLSYHRMEGEVEKLKFDEYRVFASKNIGKVDITADFFDVYYDSPINGIKNTYAVSAAIGYQLSKALQVSADIEYARTTDIDNAFAGLFKLTYRFDRDSGGEGRSTSEK